MSHARQTQGGGVHSPLVAPSPIHLPLQTSLSNSPSFSENISLASRWSGERPSAPRPIGNTPISPPPASYLTSERQQAAGKTSFQPRSLGFSPPNQHYLNSAPLHLGGSFPPQREIDPWYNPAMVARQRTPPKKKTIKRTEGKQPSFMSKLYGILEQPEYHHVSNPRVLGANFKIIRWDEAGEVIIIERPDELASKILPLVYRQSRFASFSRQLNIYGWMRKVSLKHVDRGIVDPDASTWSHPYLRRDSPKEQVLSFKRRVPPRPSQAQKRIARVQSDELSPSSESDHSFQSSSDAYHHHVFIDQDHFRPDACQPVVEMPQLIPPGFSPISASSPSPMEEHAEKQSIATFDNSTYPNRSGLPSNTGFSHEYPLFFRVGEQFPSTLLDQPSCPQTAPPEAENFPSSNYVIVRDHFRTHSVQGQPPSATIQSPTTIFQAWSNPKQPVVSMAATNFAGNSALPEQLATPTFKPSDPSTWARRGYGTLTVGIKPSYTNFHETSSTTYSAPPQSAGIYQACDNVQSENISGGLCYNSKMGYQTAQDQSRVQQNMTLSSPISSHHPGRSPTKYERRSSSTSSPYATRIPNLQEGHMCVQQRQASMSGVEKKTSGAHSKNYGMARGGEFRTPDLFASELEDADVVNSQSH